MRGEIEKRRLTRFVFDRNLLHEVSLSLADLCTLQLHLFYIHLEMFVLQVSGDNKRDSQAWHRGDGGDLQKAGEQTGLDNKCLF